MKLVTAEPAIFPTIQGDGLWMGIPMVFVRLWGCASQCSFCDTKFSWNSHYMEMDVSNVFNSVVKHKLAHVSITGGNPLQQPEELLVLVVELFAADKLIMLETQGTGHNQGLWGAIVAYLSLLSVGVKLEKILNPEVASGYWRQIRKLLDCCVFYTDLQIKIVVQCIHDVKEALRIFEMINAIRPKNTHYMLVPEWSRGTPLIKELCNFCINDMHNHTDLSISIMPQMHKLVFDCP